MKDRRTIILITVILVLIIYHAFSRSRSLKEIRNLTKQIEVNVDSLQVVNERYIELEKGYEEIYDQLSLTRESLEVFKQDLDSVLHSNINSVNKINTSITEIIEKQDSFEAVNIDTIEFRFK